MGLSKKIPGLVCAGLLVASLLQAAEAPGWKVALESVGNVKCNYAADVRKGHWASLYAAGRGSTVSLRFGSRCMALPTLWRARSSS